MIVLHFLPLNVDNLIHARPEACFSTICEVPSFRILNKRQGVSVAQRVIEYFSDGSSSTFAVSFDYPVQIEPDTFYTASAVLDGNELSYFGQEGVTEVQCGKVTFQFQCSSDSTNGTGVQGGQIPELVFYA
ncbi:BTB/POZ domain-containing protein 6-B-like isoform X2 [Pseudoliparis swirei]|uniref:BTB/POZ domain-containing protein 6-B-like isoform X2 n=1 Tax=Pseudoliparis swirei TaxID=2059687 RepID=UPI0024BDDDB3|nr:BTB/POZ domain-containing protein 6-B-like isoform X2 [Pseudoliparis swirei]